MPLQEDYRVTLETFQGPLDLLLFLIRRAEVDVQDIPIAEITDQYLAFLVQVQDIDVDLAGEFLVMAATLIEIKSRTLMPPEERPGAGGRGEGTAAGDGESIDPRYELVQQLLAYQRYRIAAEELDERRRAFAKRYPRRPGKRNRGEDPEEWRPLLPDLEMEDVHVGDLASTYERIAASIDFSRLGDHVVELDDTPIALHQEDLLDRLRRAGEGRMTLQSAFAGQNRGQRIGLFLAVLELVRLYRITVVQDDIDSEIELRLIDDPGDEQDHDGADDEGRVVTREPSHDAEHEPEAGAGGE